jgi:hypothetical protein
VSIVFELTETIMEIHNDILPTVDDEEDEDNDEEDDN